METGITGATDIEVLSGLKEGDEIVTGSYQVIRTMRNEAQVKVDNKAPAKAEDVEQKEQQDGTGSRDALVERGEQLKRDGIVIRTYDLWKTYVMGDQEIHAVSGVRYRDQARRVRGHHGTVGLRQVDADEPDRLPGHADQGAVLHQRAAGQRR